MKDFRIKTVIIGVENLHPLLEKITNTKINQGSFGLRTLDWLDVGFHVHEIISPRKDLKVSNTIWLLRWGNRLRRSFNNHIKNALFGIVYYEPSYISLREALEIGLNTYFLSNEHMIVLFYSSESGVNELRDLGLNSSIIYDMDNYNDLILEAIRRYTENKERFIDWCKIHLDELTKAWEKLKTEDFEIYGETASILGNLLTIKMDSIKLNAFKLIGLAKLKPSLISQILRQDVIPIEKRLIIAKITFNFLDKKFLAKFYLMILRNNNKPEVLYEALNGLKEAIGSRALEMTKEIAEKNPIIETLINEQDVF